MKRSNKRSYVRLAALRALLLGHPRGTICQLYYRSDRMVRLWIEQFNRGGIDALITRPKPGRPRKIKLEHVRDLLLPVLESPAQAGQVHWTGVKIHGYLKAQLSLELGYRTAVPWLHELNSHLRVPQPWPERQNQDQRQQFQLELQALCADPQVELWFGDESGFEGDPRPRRRCVQPGKPRTVSYLGDHIRQNVIGAVAPQSGTFFSLIVDGVDTAVFQFFLDEMAQAVPRKEGVRQILILDNASWHKAARLHWHCPAGYHGRAGSLSFVDGHSEIKRWKDPRTVPVLKPGTPIPLNVVSAKNQDVYWLMERTTRKR